MLKERRNTCFGKKCFCRCRNTSTLGSLPCIIHRWLENLAEVHTPRALAHLPSRTLVEQYNNVLVTRYLFNKFLRLDNVVETSTLITIIATCLIGPHENRKHGNNAKDTGRSVSLTFDNLELHRNKNIPCRLQRCALVKQTIVVFTPLFDWTCCIHVYSPRW